MNNTTLPVPVPISCDGNPSVQWYVWLIASIAWCAVGCIWFWHRSETVWTWLNGPIETFHTEQPMTRRSRITTACFVSVLVVALWPLEILISNIWSRVTHATNNQGTPKDQPRTQPAEEPQAAPPPPYDVAVAAA